MILIGDSQGESLRSMARTLGRSASTLSREFKRNGVRRRLVGDRGSGVGLYDATAASAAERWIAADGAWQYWSLPDAGIR